MCWWSWEGRGPTNQASSFPGSRCVGSYRGWRLLCQTTARDVVERMERDVDTLTENLKRLPLVRTAHV